MGYDIYWWRYKPDAENRDHFKTLEHFTVPIRGGLFQGAGAAEDLEHRLLADAAGGEAKVPFLYSLPVDELISRIRSSLPDHLIDENSALCEWEGSWEFEEGAYQVNVHKQHASFSGYGDWGDDNLGKLVGIFLELNCPAFDPQTGQRHGQDHPD